MFTGKEISCINSQPLGRFVTVSQDNQLNNSPIGFKFDVKVFKIFGRNLPATRKYKNIASGNNKAAMVIDGLESIDPWKPHGIRMFGFAEIGERTSGTMMSESLLCTPPVSWSWNIERSALVDGEFQPLRIMHSEVPE